MVTYTGAIVYPPRSAHLRPLLPLFLIGSWVCIMVSKQTINRPPLGSLLLAHCAPEWSLYIMAAAYGAETCPSPGHHTAPAIALLRLAMLSTSTVHCRLTLYAVYSTDEHTPPAAGCMSPLLIAPPPLARPSRSESDVRKGDAQTRRSVYRRVVVGSPPSSPSPASTSRRPGTWPLWPRA